ncbi:MerR family transcriptional regulator [Nonomuraea roseoviolacea]|uniref:Peroxiredoxin n=1 Tax=Nonomuraea roseoviolacea subsp. carminata TaxID=160689 RepID=A0ABT1K812_9ACTN|nr:MerR family transcriptional regulator [Nonomuraea roseoviolacea]MCP2350133.1 peroxiredoxin [Nonomuraea roseoviolacea subsp. carminata]
MRVGELARRTGVTVRALRYYEAAGLVVPRRCANGYREYDPIAVRLVEQIRSLMALGLPVEETRPFVECLVSGADAGDLCPASLATYQRAIDQMEQRIAQLAEQRDRLRGRLDVAAQLMMRPQAGRRRVVAAVDPARLVGTELPDLELVATDASRVRVQALGHGRSVLFMYPLTGRPGVDLPQGWETIPGARGCTEQACGFRDHHDDLLKAGAARVYGLSAQSSGYQREVVHRLRLPYPLLADPRLTLAAALGLPTLDTDEMTLYRRLTLIVADGRVEHVFFPVEEPAGHAEQVMRWLVEHQA